MLPHTYFCCGKFEFLPCLMSNKYCCIIEQFTNKSEFKTILKVECYGIDWEHIYWTSWILRWIFKQNKLLKTPYGTKTYRINFFDCLHFVQHVVLVTFSKSV